MVGLRSRMQAWRRLVSDTSMTTRLIVGFWVLMLLALLAFILIITTMMRTRMYRTADEGLAHDAHTSQAILQYEEEFMADEATSAANLAGMSRALTTNDVAQLKRLLTPILLSHEFNSVYVIASPARVLLQLGEPMMDEGSLARLPLVERGFELTADSTPLQVGSSLWLGAAAAHRTPEGKADAVILLCKRVDQKYLHTIQEMLGPEVALMWGDAVAYSFEAPPPELPASHLRASVGDLAEYRASGVSYHSMAINKAPYRVGAFGLPPRDGEELSMLLFQPTTALDESLWQALTWVGGTGLLIMLIGSFLAFLYARSVTRPLNHLARVAQGIADGNLEQPVQIKSRDAIGLLARAFEEMRVQVRAMLQAEQQWNAELEAKVRTKTSELQTLCEVRDQLLQETMTVQEEERRRVSRELHDETCQSLTALLANIATTELLPPADAHARLGELKASVIATLKEVNRIVFELRPALLDDCGLAPALSWYAEQRLPATTRVEVSTLGAEARLPPKVETILFRIGQEAIANAAKYAHARRVQINLLCADGDDGPSATLQIEDDGVGFDAEHVEPYSLTGRRHLGLVGMEERVGLVGGRLEIRTAPGQGTCICASVPLEPRAPEEGGDG